MIARRQPPRIRGDEYDRDIGAILDPAGDLGAGRTVTQIDVQQDHIRLKLIRHAAGCPAVQRMTDHLMSCLFYDLLKFHRQENFVFYDEHTKYTAQGHNAALELD